MENQKSVIRLQGVSPVTAGEIAKYIYQSMQDRRVTKAFSTEYVKLIQEAKGYKELVDILQSNIKKTNSNVIKAELREGISEYSLEVKRIKEKVEVSLSNATEELKKLNEMYAQAELVDQVDMMASVGFLENKIKYIIKWLK